LLVDPGGVFILGDHRRTIERLVHLGVPRELAEGYFKRPDYAEYARGHRSTAAYLGVLRAEWGGFCPADEQLIAAHGEHMYAVDVEVLRLLGRVRVPVLLATATNPIEWARMECLLGLGSAWLTTHRVWRSDHVGYLKGDTGAFRYTVTHWLPAVGWTVEAEGVAFTDDVQRNIEQAVNDGLRPTRCHRYQAGEIWGLENWLRNLDLVE
ncbi:MAG: hypothetical protein OEV37_02385, partial [Candidatus Berkelbacteria bacterium]|nr:hypothetical protein [Candidatus Berkelbacteria bacterium]